jgi:hypothetical protein
MRHAPQTIAQPRMNVPSNPLGKPAPDTGGIQKKHDPEKHDKESNLA